MSARSVNVNMMHEDDLVIGHCQLLVTEFRQFHSSPSGLEKNNLAKQHIGGYCNSTTTNISAGQLEVKNKR